MPDDRLSHVIETLRRASDPALLAELKAQNHEMLPAARERVAAQIADAEASGDAERADALRKLKAQLDNFEL